VLTAQTSLTTDLGPLMVGHHQDGYGETCLSVVIGSVSEPATVRLHSACFFGEVLLGQNCDCRQQLRAALSVMRQADSGVLLYLPQEGRGTGLATKIRALELQRTEGIDTYEAFVRLGHPPDPRSYGIAVTALRDLGVGRRLRLISNNPHKRKALIDGGFQVVEMVPLEYRVSRVAEPELKTKAVLADHLIQFDRIQFV
jgi:3,4-dihydroxy 2-butanone 4-phosphate synthase / GTP cyclohydrolase II